MDTDALEHHRFRTKVNGSCVPLGVRTHSQSFRMTDVDDDCDACVPSYPGRSSFLSITLSALPFAITFLVVAVVAYQHVCSLLSPKPVEGEIQDGKILFFRIPRRRPRISRARALSSRSIASVAFSVTIALSAVLTELLLCEISNSFNPVARKVSIHVTVASLSCLLVVVIPLLEISYVIKAAGWKFSSGSGGVARVAWILEATFYFVFFAGFWSTGLLLPRSFLGDNHERHGPIAACLERLGLTGILMMALLSGFASVSSIWHTFLMKIRPISEADINRKQAGLDTTYELLADKHNHQRRLESKIAQTPKSGILQQTLGSLRSNPALQELRTLELEIAGLKTMSSSLADSLSILRSQYAAQTQASTTRGRVSNGLSCGFACYCVYRIVSTSISIIRKSFHFRNNTSWASTDPITYTSALFARHIYPSLNQEAWTRQISFLLSGLILLASFNAVLQTFHLVSRICPSIVRAVKWNKALLIAQTAGLYVISSALLLRNMIPRNVGGVISDALGTGALHPAWTELWFECWFIGSVMSSGLGIWLSQKYNDADGLGDDGTWDTDVELGKRM